MRLRTLALAFVLSFTAFGQAKLSVEQLIGFVRSSAELKHEDRKVAEYLKKVKLSQQLDDDAIAEMRALGAGPKTMEVLEMLKTTSASLPPPVKVAPKAVPIPLPPPPDAEIKKVLDEVRTYALGYSKRLPDFICTQVTRRYVDPTGLEFYQRDDVVTARLSYFEQKEDYKVFLVNGRMTDTSIEKLGGATSTGEFGTLLREIFEAESMTDFSWERWATLRGHRMHVYRYRVAQERSKWNITYQRSQTIVPAYQGLIYVERDTNAVMRVTLEASDIPATFPIQQASTMLDYDYTKIGETEFILPLKAEIKMRQGRMLMKNEVEFRMYRKFGAEASITFDTPEPLPESMTKEQPTKPEAPKQ